MFDLVGQPRLQNQSHIFWWSDYYTCFGLMGISSNSDKVWIGKLMSCYVDFYFETLNVFCLIFRFVNAATLFSKGYTTLYYL